MKSTKKKRTKKKPLKFRILCLPEYNSYFKVVILAKGSSLPVVKGVTALAYVHASLKNSHKTKHGQREGIIYFHPKHTTPGIIAHELNHAALWFITKAVGMRASKTSKMGSYANELLASITESLTDSFYRKFPATMIK